MIYEPEEDSVLLQKEVKRYAKGNVLDIGAGSGIQALEAAKKNSVKKVTAVDIQKDVINYCKKNIKNKKIIFKQSNLFEKIKEKFDTIIFNPPYLPDDPGFKDERLYGGKNGYELVEKFLSKANDYLKDNGTILLLISSLTNKEKVEEKLVQNLFDFQIISKQHIFFEDLFVYKIKKNELQLRLKKKGIKKIEYFTHGYRGIIFTGKYKNKKVAVKAKLPKSKALGRIENEAKWIKKLNKKGIGPELIFSEKDFFVYEFVKGIFFPEYAKKKSKKKIMNVIKDVLMQCYELDKIGIDKEEMHRPFKHIIVKDEKPVLIDFERCHYTKKPKNTTQFIQYLISSKLAHIIREKGIEISKEKAMDACRKYKKTQDFNLILDLLE